MELFVKMIKCLTKLNKINMICATSFNINEDNYLETV
jgi:hypothetical protein